MPHSRVRNARPAILGGEPIRPAGPPSWPPLDPAVREALDKAFADGTWGKYHGPHCEHLAKRLESFLGCPHVILCASGTAAVELALRGVGVKPGNEVILAAYDFKGNFQDVVAVGAQPVLVDVDPENWQLDPERLSAAVSPATRAIVVSHLHGGVVDMTRVTEFARQNRLAVIEDACQMTGGTVCGRPAGTCGDVGVWSFGGSKLLSAGRGGALVTNDAGLAQRVRLYTHRGNEAYPLSELQAAVLLPQLDQLDSRNSRRAESVAALTEMLASTPLQTFRATAADSRPGYYKLGLKYDEAAFDSLTRDAFAAAMRAEGIALDAGFRALHLIHGSRRFRAAGNLSVAAEADSAVLTLHHPVLLEDRAALEEVAAAVEKVRAHAVEIARMGNPGSKIEDRGSS